MFTIIIAALAGVVLGWAIGTPVDTYLEGQLSTYPRKTIISVCVIVLVAIALFAN